MSLGRTEVVAGVQDELTRFEQLVRGLDDEAWRTPTRCEGWTVADVAAHVSGLESDIAEGRFDLLAAPNASERQVAERRGRTPAEVADELQRSVKVGIDLAAGLDDAAWEGPAPEGDVVLRRESFTFAFRAARSAS